MNIALISMPWLAPYRPSIQLGVLEAWLRLQLPEVRVDTFHDHLGVAAWMDYRLVKAVAEGVHSSWLGEALSAYLLFPERRAVLDRFLDFLVEGKAPRVDLEQDLLLPYGRYVAERVRTTDWDRYDLVGFSVSLCQTLSSVLLARRIRKRSPRPLLIFGGPAVAGRMGQSFLATFPELDAVVHGEGEQPLVELLRGLQAGRPLAGLPGVMTRPPTPPAAATADLPLPPPAWELERLEELPGPQYDSYFQTLDRLPAPAEIRRDVEVPLEGSRGCWWDRRHTKALASCQFCNLNLQWRCYREQAVDRQLEQLGRLAERHHVRRFLFVDNVMRRRQADAEELFRRIAAHPEGPFEIYMEARANLPPAQWQLLHAAGVTHCQVGIESLSTSVLRKIGKGTTAIMNLEAMKEMERWGIANPGNLLHDLPHMTVAELDENVEAIRYARAYHPLAATRFFLNYGSPYYDRFFVHRTEGMELPDRNYRAWQVMLPPAVEQTLFLSERDFEVTTPELTAAVARLAQACQDWRTHYWEIKEQGIRRLLRVEPDPASGEQLLIHDHREAEPVTHRLTGATAAVHTFFEHRHRLAACADALELSPAAVEEQLDWLTARRLVFREGKEALSLALP